MTSRVAFLRLIKSDESTRKQDQISMANQHPGAAKRRVNSIATPKAFARKVSSTRASEVQHALDDVAKKRDRAQLNDSLLRFRVRGGGGRA